MKKQFTQPTYALEPTVKSLFHPSTLLKKVSLSALLIVALLSNSLRAQVYSPSCVPPTGSAVSGQVICSGFSPSVSTGPLNPTSFTGYRITASVSTGNVVGFTPLQIVGPNADIEPANLTSVSTGIVEYRVVAYNFGLDNIDNGGLGDDCNASPINVLVTVKTCEPLCDGLTAFSDYRNSNPAPGTTSATFLNRNSSNNVNISNISPGPYGVGRPSWSVTPAGVQFTREGTLPDSTIYTFANASNTYTFNVAGLFNDGTTIEKVRIVAYDNATVPNLIYPQFYNLQDGAVLSGANRNELTDGFDPTTQASASFYFNEPIKKVVVYGIGNSDNIILQLLGCSFPSDYGDLTVGQWPVASAIVPGLMTSNVPNAFNAVSAPSTVVWAGARISTEPLTTMGGNVAANFDLYDDGLTAPPSLNLGYSNNYQVMLNANQPGTKVYYRLWFDWNADGTFNDVAAGGVDYASYGGSATVTGIPATVNVIVKPPFLISPSYKVRLVVSSDTIANVYPTAPNFVLNLSNGEIEDYAPPVLLPVELGAFLVQKQGINALVSWSVLTEINFDHYEVEYSSDANVFKTVATVAATGAKNYSVADAPLINYNASAYYRLKMVDKDGKTKYSQIRSIRWDGNGGITVGPNPLKDNMKVRLDNFTGAQKLTLMVIDAAGRKISNIAISNAVTDINTAAWTNGLYQVQITDGSKIIFNQKMIKN